jgi:hypothetical protein
VVLIFGAKDVMTDGFSCEISREMTKGQSEPRVTVKYEKKRKK